MKQNTKFKILGIGREKDKAHVKLAKQDKIELSLKEFFDKLEFNAPK